MTRHSKLTVMAVLFLALAEFCVTAHSIEVRVNLVFDNGTVLVYQGKEAGLRAGQVLEVARGGQVIGSIEVFSVTESYVQARIVSGQGKISENDIVLVGSGPVVSPGVTIIPENSDAKKKKVDGGSVAPSSKEDKKSDKTKTSAKTDEKAKSDKPTAAKKDSSSKASSTATSSKRRTSRSGSSSDDAAAADDSSAKPATSSSGRGRSRGGSSSSSSDDSDFGGGDSGSSDKAQVDPKVLARVPQYSLHMGYLFVDGDLPGSNVQLDPAFSFSIDYWIPRKRHQNLVYSLLYSRPDAKLESGGQSYDYQLRMIELSMGLVWDDISNVIGSDMYGGFAVGWRNAHTEVTCSITCGNTLGKSIERSQEGVDYHGILGFKVNKRSDVKLKYSFDEHYYTIDAGFMY